MATYTFDKIEYGGNTYVVSDSGALQLTGGQVTGPVTFGDSVSIDEATLGDLVVNGSASFTNNIQANTINEVEVGSFPKFTDTTNTTGSSNLTGSKLYVIGAMQQASSTQTYSNNQIYIDDDNSFHINGALAIKCIDNNYHGVFQPASSFTANRVYTLPNKAGTVALTSDIPTVPSNIVNTITTTAGTHTAITSQKGNVSFNVPTTAAHVGIKFGYTTSGNNRAVLQDSSGNLYVTQKDDNTNTTYALSGALSSHKFTSTLTAGGSGSGTSTSDFTLAAGTGITITDDASARKMTIACSVTNTDEKVKTTALTSGTLYYPILATGTGTATRQIDSTLNGLTYKSTAGTTSAVGTAQLTIGNSTASGTANNEQGQIILYGSTAYAHTIVGAPTAARTITLPNATGTLALNTVVTAGTSPSSGGLMSQLDKTKLDSIASNAAAIQIIRWTESS